MLLAMCTFAGCSGQGSYTLEISNGVTYDAGITDTRDGIVTGFSL